eukprot:CCRYP_020962-RA/>CCRYP_020962-RA protein AED:0.40 eAED:0.40 QI:0/-1/0/1/-1/0/1/0/86
MGHPQPPTPIQTHNITALGIVNNTIQPKQPSYGHAFALALLLHQPKVILHLLVSWSYRNLALADYVAKHHPDIHYQVIRPLFLRAS